MDAVRDFLAHRWMTLVVPMIVLGVTLAVGYALKRLLAAALRRWERKTTSNVPATIREALDGTFMIWVLIVGLHLATQSSELPDRPMRWTANILMVLWIFSLTLMAMRVASNVIRVYGSTVPGALPVTTLTQTLAQLALVILGLLVLLNQLGIPITPILTALGVGGLAVALALQDTLSNLFAGFYVAIAGQVRVGDYIKLNTGEEGYVTDITWRSTMVRSLANNLIVVPNSKLGQAIVTNFHLPEKRMGSNVKVTLSYNNDPDAVVAALEEIGKSAAREVPGMLVEPAPFARFDPGFAESGLGFTLNYQVKEFVDQFAVQHELRKRIFQRFRKQGFEFAPSKQTALLLERPGVE